MVKPASTAIFLRDTKSTIFGERMSVPTKYQASTTIDNLNISIEQSLAPYPIVAFQLEEA